ncbi:MAG: hypothetical protein WC803_04825 [Sphingomonas sp.]|jgi:hypothetical protein
MADAQRLSVEVAQAWRQGAGFQRLVRAFSGLEDRPAECVAEQAASLFSSADWLKELLAPLLAALGDDWWVQPPLRIGREGARISAVLYESRAVAISASVLSADALASAPPVASVVVPGRMIVSCCHSGGGARRALWDGGRIGENFTAAAAPVCINIGEELLVDGAVMRHDGRHLGQVIHSAQRDVVMVTAAIRADAAPFTREYATSSGALVRLAPLDDCGSRAQMLMALLRHCGNEQAGRVFEQMSYDPAFFVRWSAMREWLAMDACAALPRLVVMAMGDPHEDVRRAAEIMVPRVKKRLTCLA